MAGNGIFSLVSLIVLAGGCLFMLFIALSGAVNGGPVNDWYLLQADTSNIPGAPATSRWTYWNVCPERNGKTDCFGGNRAHYSHVHPAFPLDPPSGREFNTHQNIPANFIGTSFYFLMTRFMFAFMLIALFFAVMALFAGLLALCTRIGAYLSGLLTMIALFFQSINAALMTAAYVKGRNNFRNNGQTAHIGKYAFGFEWAAVACFFISTVLFCLGGAAGRKDKTYSSSPKRFFFKGKGRSKSTKSNRSRGSFIDSNKEYS